MQVVLVDLGGTHIRFAVANISQGHVHSVECLKTLKVADYASFQDAWREYTRQTNLSAPSAAAIAMACPVNEEPFKLTNNPWELRASAIREALGIEDLFIINDFGAVGHAVANVDASNLIPICGPDRELPDRSIVSVVGPGTGLGVAQVICRDGWYEVVESEGGHVDFAPTDEFDDFLLQRLRGLYGRVSIERIVSGPGLKAIYEALAAREGQDAQISDVNGLWSKAISGEDRMAALALERFCLSFGSAAGDIALIHGASAVVLAGSISRRIATMLRGPKFFERFTMKGRVAKRVADIPVRLIVHPEPGIFGAAAAFAKYSNSAVHSPRHLQFA